MPIGCDFLASFHFHYAMVDLIVPIGKALGLGVIGLPYISVK